MGTTEHDGLVEQLRPMAAGRGDGIDLDSPERWVIAGLKDSVSFFRHLERLIPVGSVLYFEGCDIVPNVVSFYEANKASNTVCVVRDTIFPIPETFHVPMRPDVIEGIVGILGHHHLEACFNHVKAYRDGNLLFAFHDAFDGSDFLVSDLISEQNIQAFCSALGVTYRRQANVKRDPEQSGRFLSTLENPHQLRMTWPWWKRALFFWKR